MARIVDAGVAHAASVTQAQYDKMADDTCGHCGGWHDVACPRVRRIRFRADPQQPPYEVEFWPDHEWPKDRVTFLEDVIVVEEPGA